MKFVLTVNLDNAAFDPHAGPELARILRWYAEQVEQSLAIDVDAPIHGRDVNGNRCATAVFEDREA